MRTLDHTDEPTLLGFDPTGCDLAAVGKKAPGPRLGPGERQGTRRGGGSGEGWRRLFRHCAGHHAGQEDRARRRASRSDPSPRPGHGQGTAAASRPHELGEQPALRRWGQDAGLGRVEPCDPALRPCHRQAARRCGRVRGVSARGPLAGRQAHRRGGLHGTGRAARCDDRSARPPAPGDGQAGRDQGHVRAGWRTPGDRPRGCADSPLGTEPPGSSSARSRLGKPAKERVGLVR